MNKINIKIKIGLLFLLIRISCYSISELKNISTELELHFNAPTTHKYKFTNDNFELLIYNIRPNFYYLKKNHLAGLYSQIVYHDITVVHLFDLKITFSNSDIEIKKNNLIASTQYDQLLLFSETETTFTYYKPLYLRTSFLLNDLEQFEFFTYSYQEIAMKQSFENEWISNLELVLFNYPKSLAQEQFQKVISIITHSPLISVSCCESSGIYEARIDSIKYKNVEKIGISYRLFTDIELKVGYKMKKDFILFNVKITNIIISDNTINFGKFGLSPPIVRKIIVEIITKIYQSVTSHP